MKPKQLLLYFSLFIVIGGFVYFYEYEGGQTREAAQEWANKTFKIASPDSIVGLSIQNAKGTYSAVRMGEDWEINAPLNTAGEAAQWNGIAGKIAEATTDREITDKLTNLGAYGLDNPRVTVKMTLGDGSQKTLLVGYESKVSKGGATTFVKWADSTRIVNTSNSLFTQLDKSLFDLRNKSIFSVDQPRVGKITLVGDKEKVVLEKIANRWMITEPVLLPAMPNAISSLISGFNGLKARDFVEEEPTSLKPYQLDKSARRVIFQYDDGSTREEIRIGKQRSEDELFIHWLGKHPVAIIDTNQAKRFAKSAFDFQEKKLKSFEMNVVDRFTIVGENPLAIHKKDSTGWFSSNGDSLDTEKVESLLRSLNTLQADKVGDYNASNLVQYGLSSPKMVISAYHQDTVLASILVGAETTDEFFVKAADSPHVYVVQNWRIKNLQKSIESLQ